MSFATASSDPMKPTPNSQPDPDCRGGSSSILALGAHPDDIEFGCGGVIAAETRAGRRAHFVVCSRGESGSNGNTDQRTREAEASARILGATLEFLDLGGDAHFAHSVQHAIALAAIFRHVKPGIVLSPTPVENQHPDHAILGRLVRDAARLARYAGVKELRDAPPHAIDQLLFYAVSAEGEPREIAPVFVDVSAAETIAAWTAAMEAHASQMSTRNYLELQLTRARLNGLRAGVSHAIALFPSDPIIVESLSQLSRGARRF
jgi:LmbE family N-acetylglucosaminyl deacetylase